MLHSNHVLSQCGTWCVMHKAAFVRTASARTIPLDIFQRGSRPDRSFRQLAVGLGGVLGLQADDDAGPVLRGVRNWCGGGFWCTAAPPGPWDARCC